MSSVSSRLKIKQGGGWSYLGVVSTTGSINEIIINYTSWHIKTLHACDTTSDVYSQVNLKKILHKYSMIHHHDRQIKHSKY